MELAIFGETVLGQVGPVPITTTMATSLVLSLGLAAGAAWLGRRAVRRPETVLGALALLTVEWLDAQVTEVVGRPEPRLVTFSGTAFVFIAVCNLSGQLPGAHAPTASLATTSALAATVFVAVPVAGIARRGLREYLAHYLRPNPLLLPIHLISELSRTLALSLRLFGNVMSGHVIVALLVALTGFLVPTPLMALDVLIGLLQAYIFAILATVYVGAAIRVGEE
jgi:F-type H+-transporting ATPase subunit a